MTDEPELQTYYAQFVDGRVLIDSIIHDGAEVLETYEAKCWKDAAAQYKETHWVG